MLEHLVGCFNLSSLKFLIRLGCHSDRDLSGLRNELLHGKSGELAQWHPDLGQLLCSSLCFGDVTWRNRGSCSRLLTIVEFRLDKPRNQMQSPAAGFDQRTYGGMISTTCTFFSLSNTLSAKLKLCTAAFVAQ